MDPTTEIMLDLDHKAQALQAGHELTSRVNHSMRPIVPTISIPDGSNAMHSETGKNSVSTPHAAAPRPVLIDAKRISASYPFSDPLRKFGSEFSMMGVETKWTLPAHNRFSC
jgi:hypothetical protein